MYISRLSLHLCRRYHPLMPPVIYGRENPKPFMQALYLSIVVAQAVCGSFALLKSIHSSRAAFSSLHTQQGYKNVSASDEQRVGEKNRRTLYFVSP